MQAENAFRERLAVDGPASDATQVAFDGLSTSGKCDETVDGGQS